MWRQGNPRDFCHSVPNVGEGDAKWTFRVSEQHYAFRTFFFPFWKGEPERRASEISSPVLALEVGAE